ncbi:MAG: alpha-mannosidase, partial [Prochlorococcaceae cyanobacterium]
LLGHAHLDLAWLWPVADTWAAAERTFTSVLALLERFPQLRFGHSTPALYDWLERFRPALFARIRAAVAAGRWEPLNGPWVETDCVLVGTASLLRQFQEGQRHSRATFPEWSHALAWLPDSFGFAAGLPALAATTGVGWFCTHKLAWNATNPFPHRLFRWRARCGAEVLALMSAPIGTDGDPLAIERHRLAWRRTTGEAEVLWLPGVGDHGGGPTAEMLEQLALWAAQPAMGPLAFGSLRGHLAALEAHAADLPIWRDELYLELHRGCATSRPDQKRHNRTLERLLREAELAAVLAAGPVAGAGATEPMAGEARADWRTLLFQQFHDILPGTAIPEVFEQAESQWRRARRRAVHRRDRALQRWLGPAPAAAPAGTPWWLEQLQPLPAAARTLRLPAGSWLVAHGGAWRPLQGQPASGGGQWLQPPALAGVAGLALRRLPTAAPGPGDTLPIAAPVVLRPAAGPGRRWLGNGLVEVLVGPAGVEQITGAGGGPLLAEPLAWCRWRDQGEFWDAWDISADYRSRPLAWAWSAAPRWLEQGPLCGHFVCRGRLGQSRVRLDGRLLAGSPWLELSLSIDWHQRHELLRLEIPLARPAPRWAADTPGGVIERPTDPANAREQSRWEVPLISWLAAEPAPGSAAGLGVLLDGPQGASAAPGRLGVSLLRGPTWPDPGADNGCQRLRLALLPCPQGWRAAQMPAQAQRFREPLWCRPATSMAGCDSPPGGGQPLPPLPADVQLVTLRPCQAGGGSAADAAAAVITLLNAGPCRRRFKPGPHWALEGSVDGLDQPLVAPAGELRPWQLASWRIRRS